MKKLILIAAIVLAVLFIVIIIIIGFNLGPIIKVGMQEIGPKIAQVTVKLDTVDVALLTGSATVKGLVIGNPQGYSTPQAISVSTIAVMLDPLSVTTSKIVVRSIHVVSPEITFEGGLSNNNLTKIADNVNSVSRNLAPASAGKPAPKIEVDDFLITGAKVHFYLTGVGNKDISLPDIHLTDLGRDSNGLTPAELTSAVMGAISSDTVSAVASTITALGQSVKNLGQSAVKTMGAGVGRLTSGLSGLLGK